MSVDCKKYDFDEVIDRKNTDSLKYDFGKERMGREDLIPLWVADMDFRLPDEILSDLTDRVNHGIFGYTDPKEKYFAALEKWLENNHGLKIKKEWNIVTPGVVFGIALAIKAFTNPGDAVLIQQPVYYPFSEAITDNNRKLVNNSLVYKNGRYEIDFADFEKKIVEEKVKLFILCSPHNPVGRVWKESELSRIADICIAHNVIVVEDAIHADFVYEGHKYIPIVNVNEKIKDLLVICTSPSKTFNIAGLQVSNILIPDDDLRRRFKKEEDAVGYSQGNVLGMLACQSVYEKGFEWYTQLKDYLKSNLDFVREYLKENIPEIKLVEPEGTYLIWLDCEGLNLCHRELENLIVNEAHLWLDSGIIFGKESAMFERINIACPRKILEKALFQLSEAVKKYQRK